MLKKNLTPLYVRETISNSRGLEKKFLPKLNHPYPPTPKKSNGQPHRVWGRSGFGTLAQMSSVNKMVGARSSCGGFQD